MLWSMLFPVTAGNTNSSQFVLFPSNRRFNTVQKCCLKSGSAVLKGFLSQFLSVFSSPSTPVQQLHICCRVRNGARGQSWRHYGFRTFDRYPSRLFEEITDQHLLSVVKISKGHLGEEVHSFQFVQFESHESSSSSPDKFGSLATKR